MVNEMTNEQTKQFEQTKQLDQTKFVEQIKNDIRKYFTFKLSLIQLMVTVGLIGLTLVGFYNYFFQ